MKHPVLAALVISLITVFGVGAAPAKNRPPWRLHTVGWLLRQSPTAQAAFMAGAQDCYFAEFDQLLDRTNEPYDRIILKYIAKHPPPRSHPAVSLFEPPFSPDLIAMIPHFTHRGIGEEDNDPHADSSSLEYRHYSPMARLYLITGYLDCRVAHGSPGPHHPVKYYADRIRQWYGFFNRESSWGADQFYVSSHYEDADIGDILERLVALEPGNHPADHRPRPPPARPTRAPLPPDPNVPAHDAKWWLSLDDSERVDAAIGYYDCVLNETRMIRTPIRDDFDLNILPGVVTDDFRNQSYSPLTTPVEVLHDSLDYPRALWRRPLPIGVFYPERHGMLDGAFWFRNDSDAFVQGYLLCLEAAHKPAPFELVPELVQRIDDYYGIYLLPPESHDPQAQVVRPFNHRRWHVKIADLIDDFIAARAKS